MPDELIAPIAAAVEQSVRTLAMFHQLSLSVQACLGKLEGMRTITLTSLLYSIWNRSQPDVRQWEIETMADFDTCKPGSSALYAALGRALQAELANYAKEICGGLFHDWSKFFDTMNIAVLLIEALQTSYPPVHLAYAMQQHLAPRMIKLHNFLGRPFEVWNSIIAGCLQSVPMTRVYMKRELKNVSDNNQGIIDTSDPLTGGFADTQFYVDDTAQTGRDASASAFFNKTMNSFYLFSKTRDRLKLKLSDKGKIVTNCFQIGRASCRERVFATV
jgi:hypothetical protein